jgi:hypothetical protein
MTTDQQAHIETLQAAISLISQRQATLDINCKMSAQTIVLTDSLGNRARISLSRAKDELEQLWHFQDEANEPRSNGVAFLIKMAENARTAAPGLAKDATVLVPQLKVRAFIELVDDDSLAIASIKAEGLDGLGAVSAETLLATFAHLTKGMPVWLDYQGLGEGLIILKRGHETAMRPSVNLGLLQDPAGTVVDLFYLTEGASA